MNFEESTMTFLYVVFVSAAQPTRVIVLYKNWLFSNTVHNFPWITRIKGICYSHATPNHQSLPLMSRPLVPSRGVLLILMPSPQCMIRFKDLITSSVYQYLNSISLIQNPKVWMALPSTGLEEERKKYIFSRETIPYSNHTISTQKKKWNTSLCIYTSTT